MAYEYAHKPNLCQHDRISPLKYYYDDDWGVRGTKVWYKEDGEEHAAELCMCLDCGAVFTMPWEDEENDIK